MSTESQTTEHVQPQTHDEDFDVQEHQVPWFLWLFFLLIISWAAVAWVPLFGY